MDALPAHTINSIRNEPERWKFDAYEGVRDDGLTVWVANGHYGLHIRPPNGIEYGGVTFMSSFFGPFIPWRRQLRKAVIDASWGPYV